MIIYEITSIYVLVSMFLVDHGTVIFLLRIGGKKNHYLRELGYLEPNSSSVDRHVAFKSGFLAQNSKHLNICRGDLAYTSFAE